MAEKKKLDIPAVKTIDEILSEFHFLEYSTRKRNLAYQVQYLDFQIKLLKEYVIYGSVLNSLLRNAVISITNIIEYLLFTCLRSEYGKDPKSHKFPSLIGQAKTRNMISKNLAGDLNKINDLRNNLHPSKQKDALDVNCFDKKDANACLATMRKLKKELNDYFNRKNTKVELDNTPCPYEGHVEMLFDGGQCPYCYGVHN